MFQIISRRTNQAANSTKHRATTYTWRASLIALSVMMLLVAGCSQQSFARVLPTPTATSVPPTKTPPTNLPQFADWRAAYMASDGLLHAVTLDGKTDSAGPGLPGLLFTGLSIDSGGIAPDGHTFAYFANAVDVIDVTGKTAARHFDRPGPINDAMWSHDGSKIVLAEFGVGFWTMNTVSGSPVMVPGGSFANESEIFGWIDATHLALGGSDPNSAVKLPNGNIFTTTFLLYSLDITSGKLRLIASIAHLGICFPNIDLAPDGKTALFYNTPYHENLFTPKAFAIDMESGAMKVLPNIEHILGYGFSSNAWQPGTQQIAVTVGFLVNGAVQIWMLDVQHDTVTKIAGNMYVEQWSPDGKTLIGSTGQDRAIGEGPSEISAMTFDATGQPTVVSLTKDAMTFPFIGFVRTAP